MMKRTAALLLILALALCALPSAGADGESWTCPSCGRTGNTENFCPNCGTLRPDPTWTCPSCGRTGNTDNFCPNCGTLRPGSGQPSPVTPVPINYNLEKIPGEYNAVKVRVAAVTASRFIEAGDDGLRWYPVNAADGDETTCWQFDSAGKKTLSSSSIDLMLASPETVDSIWFKNGFWAYSSDGKDQYTRNARPKDIVVEFLYSYTSDFGDGVSITLKDDSVRADWQRWDVGRHDYVTGVRIRIITYYKGNKFPNDVCLSEAMLVQRGDPAYAAEAGTADPPAYVGPAPSKSSSSPSYSGGVVYDVPLKMTLAARTGPSAGYEEVASFYTGNGYKGKTVTVMGKTLTRGVWWVEVDFTYGDSTRYRVWTGLKRVDVDLEYVPEKKALGTARLDKKTDAWYGPGGNYAKSKEAVLFHEEEVEIYGWENGYYQIDYYDVNREYQRRIWVPESCLSKIKWY